MSIEKSAQYKSFSDLLNEEGYFVYTNIGFSMMPLLREKRDIIVIQKKKQQRCKKYDVILYKRDNQYILHRVLKVLPNGYIIAGDHNTFLEYDVTDDMIIGVMTRVIRNGKNIYPNDWRYKLYYHLWCDFFPFRVFLLKAKAKSGKIIKRVLKVIGK